MDLQQIPLVTALEQANAPLGESDQIVFRFVQLEQVHIEPLVDGAAVEDELMGRDGKQGLGQFPDALPVKVFQVLRGHDEVGFLFADPFQGVADVLNDGRSNRYIVGKPHIQLIQRRRGIANGQQAVRHIGQDIEQHGAPHILTGLQQTFDPEDDKAGGGHIGVPVEELRLSALAHGVEAQQDLLQQFRRIELVAVPIVLFVFLLDQFVEIGEDKQRIKPFPPVA